MYRNIFLPHGQLEIIVFASIIAGEVLRPSGPKKENFLHPKSPCSYFTMRITEKLSTRYSVHISYWYGAFIMMGVTRSSFCWIHRYLVSRIISYNRQITWSRLFLSSSVYVTNTCPKSLSLMHLMDVLHWGWKKKEKANI